MIPLADRALTWNDAAMDPMSPELLTILGVVGVHVVPKLLMRFRIPAPVSALLLGIVAAAVVPSLASDGTLWLLATIGIAALFLFAGMEVDAEVIGKRPGLLLAGLLVHAVLLGLATVFGVFGLHMDVAPAMLLGLGITTPSGGFIVDGLSVLGADASERHRIRDAALTAELLALVVFFGVTQSTSVGHMFGALVAIVALLLVLPWSLRALARAILPYAPNSEFPLLVLTAIVGAFVTRKLGIYYLVGAFTVGIVARRLEDEVPELASEKNLSAIQLFAGFFAPFYFARAGMGFELDSLGFKAIGLAVALLVCATPVRVGLVTLARHAVDRASLRADARLATAIVPTFVFSLVMASVLAETFHTPGWIVGGLLLYAVLNALVPTFLFDRFAGGATIGVASASETGTDEARADAVAEPSDDAARGAGTAAATAAEAGPPVPASIPTAESSTVPAPNDGGSPTGEPSTGGVMDGRDDAVTKVG